MVKIIYEKHLKCKLQSYMLRCDDCNEIEDSFIKYLPEALFSMEQTGWTTSRDIYGRVTHVCARCSREMAKRDTCEWVLKEGRRLVTDCGIKDIRSTSNHKFKFCPLCGKKLKIKFG